MLVRSVCMRCSSIVAVGLSYFTNKKYATESNDRVVDDLYLLLEHFFNEHNKLRKAQLHIFAARYDAKSAVQSATLLKEKQFDCNLQ